MRKKVFVFNLLWELPFDRIILKPDFRQQEFYMRGFLEWLFDHVELSTIDDVAWLVLYGSFSSFIAGMINHIMLVASKGTASITSIIPIDFIVTVIPTSIVGYIVCVVMFLISVSVRLYIKRLQKLFRY